MRAGATTGRFIAIASVAAAVWTQSALAQTVVLEPDYHAPHRIGIETTVAIGAAAFHDLSSNAFTTQSALPDVQFGPGFGGTIGLGYRYLPWLSTGATLHYEYHPLADSLVHATSARADVLRFGIYTRAYLGTAFHWDRFEPWIAVALDPGASVWQSYAFANSTASLSTSAIVFPASVGLDVRITRSVAVGAMVEASWWVPVQRCAILTGAAFTVPQGCNDSGLRDQASVFAGVSARFTTER